MCVCAIAALPVIALGDDAAPAADPVVPESLLEAREDVAAANEIAASAPLATAAGCAATIDVPGIGETCRTRDGLLQVELEDGSTSTIHGLDAPPLSADGYAPSAMPRVNGASAADITCTGDDTAHYTLVYARPANVGDRYAAVAPALRTEAYRMSAFIDAESQSVDPLKGKRLPFVCDGGVPRVLNVTIGAVGEGGVDFLPLVNQLKSTGLSYNVPTGNERYVVFVDAPSPTGASGTGHVFTGDSRSSADNANNHGGMYAVQYRYPDGGNLPRWDVLLHEVAHTMGAVVGTAPNASGGGHCNDGEDLMCYDDGYNSGRYTPGTCATKVLDCNRNDYFNPSPAAGSYLATSWNMAGPNNRWLEHRGAGDQTAPTTPSGIAQTGTSNAAVGLAWNPSSDDVGVVGYEVVVSQPGGATRASASTARRTITVSGLQPDTTYDVAVVALDKAGNRSAAGTGTASTNDRADVVAPGAPGGASFRLDGKTAVLTWSDATDDVGVDTYAVQQVVVDAKGRATRGLRSAGVPTRETSITVPTRGMRPGVAYPFRVVARDAAGNASTPRTINVRLAVDRVKPTAPGALKVASTRGTTAVLTWKASRDANGVRGYRVYRKVGAKWKLLSPKALSASVTKLTVKGLKRGRPVTVRLAAFDAAGNTNFSRAVTLRAR